MQRESTKTLRDAINAYLRETNLGDGIIRLRIFKAWDSVTGEAVAAVTYNKFFKDDCLHCKIGSSLIRSNLQLRLREIADSMNQLLGKEYVKRIILK
ncbi:MAG: DUF721 domain-containing protein [Bacteroidales bacterium]|nr:DUF721 domain-containing protein [Bacteroidales bacterium]